MNARLITDREVVEGRVGSPIVLDDNTLITPSARDRAVLLGIPIVERGEGAPIASVRGAACDVCGRASCTGCTAGTCAGGGAAIPEGLADGLYLVRIEGGHATSVMTASGPGTMVRATTGRNG